MEIGGRDNETTSVRGRETERGRAGEDNSITRTNGGAVLSGSRLLASEHYLALSTNERSPFSVLPHSDLERKLGINENETQ